MATKGGEGLCGERGWSNDRLSLQGLDFKGVGWMERGGAVYSPAFRSVRECAMTADEATIISASSDASFWNLKVWDGRRGLELFNLVSRSHRVSGCAVSADGMTIVSASSDTTISVWDGGTGVKRFTLSGGAVAVKSCAISADGTTIVSASGDKLTIWDVSGVRRFTLSGHVDGVYSCAVSADGAIIISVSADKTIKLWDGRTGKCLSTLNVDGPMYRCACSADGEVIAAVGARGIYFLRLLR